MGNISYTKLILYFYIIFTAVSLAGNFIIEYRSISLITIVLYLLFIFSLLIGSYIGEKIPLLTIKNKKKIDVYRFLLIIWFISFGATLIGWIYVINYYGNIAYVFAHGTMIREETIGDGMQLKPNIVTYLSSIGFVGLPISLSLYATSRETKLIRLGILFFLTIVLGDLQTFGRIGMLFCIFVIIGFFVLFIKKINYIKSLSWGIPLLAIFMLPKFIRAGNTLEGIGSRYSNCLIFHIHPAFEPFISVFAYYFSGIYAFDYLIDNFDSSFSFGKRNLSAIFNLLNKIFEFQDSRNSIIADIAYIPFDTNIYTLAGELFMDLGVFGIFSGSLFFGLLAGYLFRYNGVFGMALKLVLFAWLLETPLYNLFSFGGFLISFVIIIFFTLFFDGNKNFNNYCKL